MKERLREKLNILSHMNGDRQKYDKGDWYNEFIRILEEQYETNKT